MSLLLRSQAQRAGKGNFFASSEIRATAAKPTCLGIATGLVVWYEWLAQVSWPQLPNGEALKEVRWQHEPQ